MGGLRVITGGYRRLKGRSAHFSWQTNTQNLPIIYRWWDARVRRLNVQHCNAIFKRKRNFNSSKVDLVHDFLIDCVRWLAAKVFSVQTFECQANVDLDNLLTNFTMLLMIKQNQCWSWKFTMICTFASIVALFSEQFLQNAKRYWQKFATY